MTLQEVDFMLWQFGVWVRSEADNLRYKSPLFAVMREMGALSDSGGTVAIGDELAMRVDAYLTLLRQSQPEQVDAVLPEDSGVWDIRTTKRRAETGSIEIKDQE